MIKSNWNVKLNGRGINVNNIVNNICKNRGITNTYQFMHPSGCILPSTMLKNIEGAASVFMKNVHSNSKFVIYADVDADGCSSAAIIYHYLKSIGIDADTYINNKKQHGLKEEFFDCCTNYDILIIVDSINDDMELYNHVLYSGKDLIVLDHHIPSEEILANQDRINLVSSANNYQNPSLSGSGVAWKFVNYLDYINNTNYADRLYDLATVGIIADVCSVGVNSMENREICDKGLKNITNVGLQTILNKMEADSNDISFTIAPLINAANRMNENKLALQLFLTDKPSEAKDIIKKLKKIKDTQKQLVDNLFQIIESKAKDQLKQKCMYFEIDDSYGTLGGLIATKAADKWKRPVVIYRKTSIGYEGSIRATGVDNFSKLVNDSMLANCAGHENSAGIFIPFENLYKLENYIEDTLANTEFHEKEDIDLVIDRSQITPLLINKLYELNRISGAEFPTVKVLIENVVNYNIKKLSQGKHLCIEVPDMKFLKWNFQDWDNIIEDESFSAVGTINESFFAGKKSIDMIVEDFVFSQTAKKSSLW